jgi:hypothetical protein
VQPFGCCSCGGGLGRVLLGAAEIGDRFGECGEPDYKGDRGKRRVMGDGTERRQ